MEEARWVIDRWQLDYNRRRVHSALDYQTPAAYAADCVPPASATPQPPKYSRITLPRFSHSYWIKVWGVCGFGQNHSLCNSICFATGDRCEIGSVKKGQSQRFRRIYLTTAQHLLVPGLLPARAPARV